MTSATPALSTMRNPVPPMSQPITSLGVGVDAAAGVDDLGSGEAELAGARRLPTITTAAAPSPNRPLATMFAIESSLALHRQRAQLDRDQQGDVVRVPLQVVVHPGDPGRAGDAAEAEDRQTLDVGAHPEPLHEQRVDGRRGDAGDGGEEQEVDVRGEESRGGERLGHGPLGQRGALGDEEVVGLAERAQRAVSFERHDQIAALDAAGRVDAAHHGLPPRVARDHREERGGDFALAVAAGGKHGRHGHDTAHMRNVPLGRFARRDCGEL